MKNNPDPERRERVSAWARANGLDPSTVAEPVEIENGTTIRYRELIETRDGKPVWEERRTPLRVPPPTEPDHP